MSHLSTYLAIYLSIYLNIPSIYLPIFLSKSMNKHSPTKISPGGQTRFRRQRHPLELLQGTAFGLRRGAAQRRGELLRRGPVAPFFLGTFGAPVGSWESGGKRAGNMLEMWKQTRKWRENAGHLWGIG